MSLRSSKVTASLADLDFDSELENIIQTTNNYLTINPNIIKRPKFQIDKPTEISNRSATMAPPVFKSSMVNVNFYRALLISVKNWCKIFIIPPTPTFQDEND